MNLRVFLVSLCLVLLGTQAFGADERYAYSQGAHGFLIRDYKEKLAGFLKASFPDRPTVPTATDEFDGPTTEQTRLLQSTLSGPHSSAGHAGPAEFAAVGLPWPDDFLRCVNLIDCWEGTLKKLEGSSESEDTFPNVTFGIVGFTSEDGSLQEFLRHANAASNGALFQMARDRLAPREAARFVELIEKYRPGDRKRNHEEFVKFAIRNPHADPDEQQPRPEIAQLFAAFDSIPHFREIQLAAARKKSWEDEVPEYHEHLFGAKAARTLHTNLFCFDMTVLTNGPAKKELRKLEATHWHTETERMNQIAAVMKRSSEFKNDKEKRADVQERERCIIDGHGEVHDDDYDLRAFALFPEP